MLKDFKQFEKLESLIDVSLNAEIRLAPELRFNKYDELINLPEEEFISCLYNFYSFDQGLQTLNLIEDRRKSHQTDPTVIDIQLVKYLVKIGINNEALRVINQTKKNPKIKHEYLEDLILLEYKIYRSEGNWQKAWMALEGGFSLDQSSEKILMQMCVIAFEQPRLAEFRSKILEIMSHFETLQVDYKYFRIRSLELIGNHTRAKRLYLMHILKNPNHTPTFKSLLTQQGTQILSSLAGQAFLNNANPDELMSLIANNKQLFTKTLIVDQKS